MISSKHDKTKKLILFFIPFILVVVIMLPRLISPQFGFFDDASMLTQSRNFLQGDFSMGHDKQAGRFRPIYWLYYTLIYSFAGYQPFWYFFGNLIIFLILVYQIRVLMKDMNCSNWQILLGSVVFVFSMPIIENFYTLSKGEPLQLVFLLASIIAFEKLKLEKQNRNMWFFGILSSISILFATMVKETTIVMIPITILWVAILCLFREVSFSKERKAYLIFAGAVIFGVVMYFLFRTIFGAPPPTGGTYTNRYLLSLKTLIETLARWMTLFAFYFHYLIPLGAAIILVFIFKNTVDKRALLDIYRWITWCLLWFAILIPWSYAELYFLLPFGLGSAIVIGLIIPHIVKAIKQSQKFARVTLITLSVITGILFLLSLPNYITDANTQLTFDQINQQMLVYAVKYIPQDGTAYTNIESSNEYSERLEQTLKEHNSRTDITYGNIDSQRLNSLVDETGVIILMPYIINQPRLTVRAGVEEVYQTRWNERMLEETRDARVHLNSFSNRFRLLNVNLPILICPILGEIGFCENPDPIIDTRIFTYGWEVIQIK